MPKAHTATEPNERVKPWPCERPWKMARVCVDITHSHSIVEAEAKVINLAVGISPWE